MSKRSILWQSRLSRLKSNPMLLLKTFYYNKLPGLSIAARKRKKQSIKYFFQEMTDFISYYDVNSIKVDKEYIWPYLRNIFWVATNTVSLGKINRQYIIPGYLQNSSISQVTVLERLKIKYICDAHEIDELDNTPKDILFFHNTNGTENLVLENRKIYHRLIDPLFEVAQTYLKCEKIEIVKNKNFPVLLHKRYYHQTNIIFLPFRENENLVEGLKYNQTFFSLLKKYLPSVSIGNSKHLQDIINYNLNIKKGYVDLLKKKNPKVIFIYGFHYQAPLISAADELGILTVDIQHGLQVGWNPLYNNYDEIPQEGYQAFPDYFAVWGEREYNNILKTFRDHKKHKPIYMGSPWLKCIEDFSTPLSTHLIEKIESFETVILIIMQNQTKIPQLFLDIINQTEGNLLWVIRHHPVGEKYQSEDFSKTKNILIDEEIDSVLFNQLFKHVSIAISEGSALALEASYFGVHNIITSDMGLDNYKYEIENNIFHYIETPEQFQNALKRIKTKKKPIRYGFKEVDTKTFLNQLLHFSEAKRKQNLAIRDDDGASIDISQLFLKMNEQLQEKNIQNAIETFFVLRERLGKNTSVNQLYIDEQELWMKEAKIFQRRIDSTFNINDNHKCIIIGDSLHLPRPHETKMKNYGIEFTSTYMLNQKSLQTKSWGQRFLTTEKLLDNWDLMVGDINNKYLIIHLGLNDSAPRIFLEKQRLALRLYDESTQLGIIDFGKKYRKEIIVSQQEHSYVPYNLFTKNTMNIVQKSKKAGVKKLFFVTIIEFPDEHELTTPGHKDITHKYNKALLDLEKMYDWINVIDLNKVIYDIGFRKCMLEDNMHLSHYGHEILTNEIIKKVEK